MVLDGQKEINPLINQFDTVEMYMFEYDTFVSLYIIS